MFLEISAAHPLGDLEYPQRERGVQKIKKNYKANREFQAVSSLKRSNISLFKCLKQS